MGNAGSFSYDRTVIVDWKGNVDKVLESINIISEGGRVFDLENNSSVKLKKEMTVPGSLIN